MCVLQELYGELGVPDISANEQRGEEVLREQGIVKGKMAVSYKVENQHEYWMRNQKRERTRV